MKHIIPGVLHWSKFVPEKGYDFNSYAFGDVVIDPVETQALSIVSHIILTNADHERYAYELRRKFGAKIWAPVLDAALLTESPDSTYSDGDVLPGEFVAMHMTDGKTPGETLLYHKEKKILIAGDAVIGWPKGELSLLPAMKYADTVATKKALQHLLHLDFEILLVGDGLSVLHQPKEALRRLLLRTENLHLKFPVV